MDLRKTLIQSRKLPAQYVESLWEAIYQENIKVETLSSVLAFYMHHRVYPPPVQKAFDTLLIAFTSTKVARKTRILLYQIVEEMCHWLSPSCIADTARLSSTSVTAELLPCFLINKDICLPDTYFYEKLISALTSPGLSQDERSKVLGFVMNTLPADMQPLLNKHLILWLSYSRTAQTTSYIFRSPDVTEMDGSIGLGTCTVLTLVSSITDLHLLSLVAFSHIQSYMRRISMRAQLNQELVNCVLGYCSTLMAQVSKKPINRHDKQLIPAVLEEILGIVRVVKSADDSCQARCQLMAANLQLLADQLKLTPLLISVWDYQLSSDGGSNLSERVLNEVIHSEFSQGVVSQRVATVLADHVEQLAPHLARFTPNLLRLLATHPSTLLEEFLDIVPHLTSDTELIVEVLQSLIDLPLFSACVCIHQTAHLVHAGIKVPALLAARQTVETEHKTIYQHFMRSQAAEGQTDPLLRLYPNFWSCLGPVLSMGLVQVCSQVAPLLLDVFLESASSSSSLQAHSRLLPALLSRVTLLSPLQSYQAAILRVVSQHVGRMCLQQPDLLGSTSVAQFLSIMSHMQLCPELYEAVVTAVGDHVKRVEVIVSLFETLEAVLREMLLDDSSANIRLEMCVCLTLAKLASLQIDLIPRTIAAFEKIQRSLKNTSEEEKEMLLQQVKELIRILKNPRVANVVLCPCSKEDVAISALVKVLLQFLE